MSKNRSYSGLGTALRAARKQAGLTQADLAEAAGCAARTIGPVESGEGRADTLVALAAVLGLEIGGRSLPSGPHLGARLALLRSRHGISLRELADSAQVSPPTIAALEKGGLGHLAALERIAAVLGAGLCLLPVGEAMAFFASAGNSTAHHGWTTPPDVLEKLYGVVGGAFSLDPCSPTANRRTAPVRAKVRFTAEQDGLALPWHGTVFVNPPYGRVLCDWIARCRAEVESRRATLVVALIPARPDTGWWHDDIAHVADVWMLRGRLRFGGAGGESAPFPSALIIWGATDEHRQRMREGFPSAWHIPAWPCTGACRAG